MGSAQSFFVHRDARGGKVHTSKRFYIYALSLTPSMRQTFYIGKGQRNRACDHGLEAGRGHLCPKCAVIRYAYTVRRHCYWWSILSETDDEGEAFWQEMKAITSYPYGRLCNMAKIPVAVKWFPPMGSQRIWSAAITHRDPVSRQEETTVIDGRDDYAMDEIREVYDRLVLNYYSHLSGFREQEWRVL